MLAEEEGRLEELFTRCKLRRCEQHTLVGSLFIYDSLHGAIYEVNCSLVCITFVFASATKSGERLTGYKYKTIKSLEARHASKRAEREESGRMIMNNVRSFYTSYNSIFFYDANCFQQPVINCTMQALSKAEMSKHCTQSYSR